MSTTKPRITLTLEPNVYEVLRRVSVASGDSMSAVVTNLLDVAVPQMERMVLVLEHAKAMPEATKEEFRASLARGEARLLSAVADVNDVAAELLRGGVYDATPAAAAEAEPRARQPASGRLTPVPVTRGSGREKRPAKGVHRGRV